MPLESPGWFEALVEAAVASHRPDLGSRSARDAGALPPGPGRARRYLRGIFRETGLLYGTPHGAAADTTGGKEATLFVAVLETLCRIGLDVAAQADAPPGPRKEQLLLLFAALIEDLDDAELVHRRVERPGRVDAGTTPPSGARAVQRLWTRGMATMSGEVRKAFGRAAQPAGAPVKRALVPRAVWARVEEALSERAVSLSADPYYGLVLHNGALYADAHLFGRLALATFTRGDFPREAMERRLRFAALQKTLLVEVLVGLVCAERPPSFPVRRAILRQIDDLKLPDELAEQARASARRAFVKGPHLKRVLAAVRSHDLKRFVVEQVVLSSLVEGRRSPRELDWTRDLAGQLGVSREGLAAIELEMAEFYARHREVVDVFRLSDGAEVMGEELVDDMSAAVQKNYRKLLKEIRGTGELSVLLARAAAGQTLDAPERRKMREQLLEVAKTVPALALFAAPGGLLLLVALAKVLPPDALPGWAKDDEGADEEPGPTARRFQR